MRSVSRAGIYVASTGSMDCAGARGIVQSVGEARPQGFEECSGTAEFAESLGDEDETGSSWFRANGTTSASLSAQYVDGAQPLGTAQCHDRVRTRSFF